MFQTLATGNRGRDVIHEGGGVVARHSSLAGLGRLGLFSAWAGLGRGFLDLVDALRFGDGTSSFSVIGERSRGGGDWELYFHVRRLGVAKMGERLLPAVLELSETLGIGVGAWGLLQPAE